MIFLYCRTDHGQGWGRLNSILPEEGVWRSGQTW